jgi:hypothetical protein
MIEATVYAFIVIVGFFVILIGTLSIVPVVFRLASANIKAKHPDPKLSYDASFDYASLPLPDDHSVHLVHVGDPLNGSASDADGHQAGLEKPVSEESIIAHRKE